MAAGDLVVADFQAELRTVLMGQTTNIRIGPHPLSIEGLGNPLPKTTDLDFAIKDGAFGGRDLRSVRVVTIPLVIRESSAANAMAALTTLKTAWDISATDIPLYIRLPSWGKFHVNGRPRGLIEHLGQMRFGVITCLGTFVCPTPTIVTP